MNHWLQWLLKADILSAIGSIASAIVALVLASVTLGMTWRQIRRERLERTPNLFITDTEWHLHSFDFTFVNLGQYPVYVYAVVLDLYGHPTQRQWVEHLLIQAGESKVHTVRTEPFVYSIQGEFRIIFRYGATGLIYHRLAFPFEIKGGVDTAVGEDGQPKLAGTIEQTIEVPLWKQKLTVDFGLDRNIINRRLLGERVFTNSRK